MRPDRRWLIPFCATLLACENTPNEDDGLFIPPLEDDDDVDAPPVVRSAVTPPPVSGGTLLSMNDGDLAVAADPDRDLIHVVDLAEATQLHAIEMRAGDEPGRLVADDAGIVHVAMRRGGAIVDLDPIAGTVTGRRAVCANPRGIAYEAETESLHVACAGGVLVSLPAAGGDPWRRIKLGPDLRDVVVTDEGLIVTTFRSARVTRIDPEGNVIDEQGLPVRRRSIGFENPTSDIMVPNTAWRTVSTPDGGWLMVHQASTQRELAVAGPEEEPPPDSGYGGGGTPENPCGNAVHTVLSLADEAFSAHSSPLLREATLPVDVAIAPDGRRVAIAAAGHQHFQDQTPNSTGVVWVPVDHFTSDTEPGCETPPSLPVASGQYTAVTFDTHGRILAQSREPAFITRIDPEDPHRPFKLTLEGPSRADTGHGLFHLDAGAGVSCATCHPEGGDDGHVWRFLNIGERHTPSLAIGLEGTAPFHWEGDLHDMRELVDDVHVGRMGGAPLNDEWVEALQSYMFSIPIPEPQRTTVEPAVQRGAALFTDWGCATCHAGQAMAGNENVMLDFEYSLQVPGLRSVSLHPPYMHDGRSPDLKSAVEDMLQRTRPDAASPSDEDMADMLAYLESL